MTPPQCDSPFGRATPRDNDALSLIHDANEPLYLVNPIPKGDARQHQALLNSLTRLPAPGGNGAHQSIFKTALLAVSAGLQHREWRGLLHSNMPRGTRTVRHREYWTQWNNAVRQIAGATRYENCGPIPQPAWPNGRAIFEALVSSCPEISLSSLPDTVSNARRSPQSLSSAEALYEFLDYAPFSPDDRIFIGPEQCPRREQERHIRSIEDLLSSLECGRRAPDGPFFSYHVLDGQPHQIDDGEPSFRCKEAVIKFPLYAGEIDLVDGQRVPIDIQLRFWMALNRIGLPLYALTHSGGKSVHALVVSGVSSEEDYSYWVKEEIYRRRFNQIPGWDTSICSLSRLVRLAGAIRPNNGAVQSLLWLNRRVPPLHPSMVIRQLDQFVNAISAPRTASTMMILGELRAPELGNDPTELLKSRFLYLGAICLFVGPTGSGKSVWVLQAAIYWAVGRTFFGLQPGDVYQKLGMEILIVQAENDEGDLAEMRDGVIKGTTDLNTAEKELALRRVRIDTISDRSGDAFVSEIDRLLHESPSIRLLIVDPAFAYLGGDSNSQRDVSHFMRELLTPVLQKRNVGMILVHHPNKPLRGKDKEHLETGDYAYLGAGSAEWINPARAALALRSTGSETVFELRAAKRGRRLQWMDANGEPTLVKHIAHHSAPGVICWRDATVQEVTDVTSKGKRGRPSQVDTLPCVRAVVQQPGESQGFYTARLAKALSCSDESVRKALKACVSAGLLREQLSGGFKRYHATETGREKANP